MSYKNLECMMTPTKDNKYIEFQSNKLFEIHKKMLIYERKPY